jgi:hypothetical protein
MSAFIPKKYTSQKAAQILIDDNFLNFFRVPVLYRKSFLRKVERGLRRAAAAGAESVKQQIQTMNAIGFGFMRDSVTYEMETVTSGEYLIKGAIGTRAWYDVLVHEGLGRHGGSREVPSKYKPSAEQLAIVEPDWETRNDPENRKKYWKKSPKTPRPFLTEGIKKAKTRMKVEYMGGLRDAMGELGSRAGGTPKHDISAVLFGGKIR